MNLDKLIKRELIAEFIPKVEAEGLNNFDLEIINSNPDETAITKEQESKV